MSVDAAEAPNWTPPRWLNRMMTVLLRTPGLQRLLGRGTALITFTGRRTGREITTPVSYVESNGRILITGHRKRQWWRNLVSNPEVEIRLAGEVRKGQASVMDDPDNALEEFLALLETQPVVARISGVPIDDGGRPDPMRAREVLGYTVVVGIKLEEADSRQEV